MWPGFSAPPLPARSSCTKGVRSCRVFELPPWGGAELVVLAGFQCGVCVKDSRHFLPLGGRTPSLSSLLHSLHASPVSKANLCQAFVALWQRPLLDEWIRCRAIRNTIRQSRPQCGFSTPPPPARSCSARVQGYLAYKKPPPRRTL